jgi:putative ABC transport system permease protein
MEFIKLSVNNLFRHKIRSMLTLIGIAASVSVLFSIISFNRGFEKGLNHELNKTGIHFMIVPAGCPHEVASLVLHGAVTPKFIDINTLDAVRKLNGVDLVSPMLITQLANQEKDRLDLVHGMDMAHISALKPGWKLEGTAPENDDGLIIGSEIAAHDKIKIGDTVQYGEHRFIVSAILGKTGSQEDAFVYMPIRGLQEVLEKRDGLTAIGVKVAAPERLDQVTEELTMQVPGIQIVTMNEVMRSLGSLANSAKVLSMSIAVIAMLISAVGVMNSILMSVFERTQEIGMMRAVGASRLDIFRIIMKETLLLTATASVAGILLSSVAAGIIEMFVRSFMPYVPSGKMIHFEPLLALFCLVFSMSVGLLAGGYPAWKASKINPIEAIKG